MGGNKNHDKTERKIEIKNERKGNYTAPGMK